MELLKYFLNPPRPEVHILFTTYDCDVWLGLLDKVFAGILYGVPGYHNRVMTRVVTRAILDEDYVSDLDSEEEVFLCQIPPRALRSSCEKLPNIRFRQIHLKARKEGTRCLSH